MQQKFQEKDTQLLSKKHKTVMELRLYFDFKPRLRKAQNDVVICLDSYFRDRVVQSWWVGIQTLSAFGFTIFALRSLIQRSLSIRIKWFGWKNCKTKKWWQMSLTKLFHKQTYYICCTNKVSQTNSLLCGNFRILNTTERIELYTLSLVFMRSDFPFKTTTNCISKALNWSKSSSPLKTMSSISCHLCEHVFFSVDATNSGIWAYFFLFKSG